MKELEKRAIIYTRVSSARQEAEGSGNKSQESRCRELADKEGLIVEKVFTDVFSGGGDFWNRPAMRELLNFLALNCKKFKYVIIFDDLKRFARDTEFHIRLRSTFKGYNVELKCLNYKFEDSPEGRFVETVFAAQNQLDREQNQRQVIQKQKARLMDGYWAFGRKLGYTLTKVNGQGKVCIPNEKAPHIKEAIEGFVNGRFKAIIEVGTYLKENGVIKTNHNKKTHQTANVILEDVFYAGYVEFLKNDWDVSRRLGKHKAIITLDTYNLVQEKLRKMREGKNERQHQVYRDEFELRGIIRCAICNTKMDSYITSKKKDGVVCYQREYYDCKNTECVNYCKTVYAPDSHIAFHNILKQVAPKEEMIKIGEEVFENAISDFAINLKLIQDANQNKITELDGQINSLVESIIDCKNPTIKKTYESKLEALTINRQVLVNNLEKPVDLEIVSRTSRNKMLEFIKSPYNIWITCDSKQKRELYKYIFIEDFKVARNMQSRSPKLSKIYQYLQGENKKTESLESVDLLKWTLGDSNS